MKFISNKTKARTLIVMIAAASPFIVIYASARAAYDEFLNSCRDFRPCVKFLAGCWKSA